MNAIRLACALALMVGLPTGAFAQTRAKADVACRPTGTVLQYDCTIALTNARTSQPLGGVTLTVGADMPSMPMAHSVKPVKAKPGGAPGEYEARIELEMYGEWALRLNVRGPARDVIVKKLDFREPPR